MNPEKEIEKLMMAVGVLGEFGYALTTSFEKAGYSHEDALTLTANMLSNLMKPKET